MGRRDYNAGGTGNKGQEVMGLSPAWPQAKPNGHRDMALSCRHQDVAERMTKSGC